MSSKTIYFCDRCKKEENPKCMHKLEFGKYDYFYEMGFGMYDHTLEICYDCSKELHDFMKVEFKGVEK